MHYQMILTTFTKQINIAILIIPQTDKFFDNLCMNGHYFASTAILSVILSIYTLFYKRKVSAE